jgi:hypothetical protein
MPFARVVVLQVSTATTSEYNWRAALRSNAPHAPCVEAGGRTMGTGLEPKE